MSVYHKFDTPDIVHYVLSTSPRSDFASGSSGWRGSTGTSGSVSMFGGIRSKETTGDELSIQPIYELETYTIDGKIELSASYPFTGSITYARCVDRELDLNDEVHDSFWGEERLRPILNLYEYYGRTNPEYTTASYDYYTLYFEKLSPNRVKFVDSGAARDGLNFMTSSYTFEAIIKPLTVTGAMDGSGIFTLATRFETPVSGMELYRFYITGSDGSLVFSASFPSAAGDIHTSSLSLTRDRYQHVAVRVIDNTGSFFIDMKEAGTFTMSEDLRTEASSNSNLYVGNDGNTGNFHGFMHEFRAWKAGRTFTELSSSHDRYIANTGSQDDLVAYLRFNDGPLSTEHGQSAGSGAFDYSPIGEHAVLEQFNEPNHILKPRPVWHPSDNRNLIVPKAEAVGTPDEFMVVHVPSAYYGRQIATGSVRMVCNAFFSSSLQRVLVDDGRGGLYLSGSATSSSLDTREEYQGVTWNKVGNVFYSEGLIVIKDPGMLDFGFNNPSSSLQDDLLQVSFSGLQQIPTSVFSCRINGAEANASRNPSYSWRNPDTGKLQLNLSKPITYVTTVGIYNEERKLVAVAKLASPVRNREKDKINIRLKMDF